MGLQKQAEKLKKRVEKKRARKQSHDAPKRRKNYGSTQNCVSPFDSDDDEEEEEEDEVTGDEHDDEDVRYVKKSLLPIT